MKSYKGLNQDSKDLDLLLSDLELVREIAENRPWELFIPHSKQKAALLDDHLEQWIFGGNRSGKTEYVVANRMMTLVGASKSKPLAPRDGGWRGYIVSQTMRKQREVIQDKVLRYLPLKYIKQKANGEPIIYQSKGVWDYIELVDPAKNDPMRKKHAWNLHGAIIWFKSYEEGVMGFEGSSIDFADCDEEPPKSVYEAIQARLLDRKRAGNGWFTCAMTPDPDSGLTWTYDDIIEKDGEDPDRIVIVMSSYDNKVNLGEAEIRKLETTYGKTVSRARIYGIHVSREGMVLDKLRPYPYPEGNILPDFTPDWRFYTPYESTDWGYKHPWHWGFYAVSKDGEIIKYDEIHETQITEPQMKSLVYKKRKEHGYEEPALCVGDPSMQRTQSGGFTILDNLAAGVDQEYDGSGRTDYERGKNVWIGEGEPPEDRNHKDYIWFPVIVKPANNDRDAGWKLLNQRLDFEPGVGRPSWFYTSNCVHSIREAKNLHYPPDKETKVNKIKEISRKRKDDAPDADRYLSNEDPIYLNDYNPRENWLTDTDEDLTKQPRDQKRKKARYTPVDEDLEDYEDGSSTPVSDSVTGW